MKPPLPRKRERVWQHVNGAEGASMFNENLSKDIKALAYEKSIDVERVFKALEDALATAARKYYKTREPLETELDRTTGNVQIWVIKEIVEDENQIEDPQAQWTLEQARAIDPEAVVGGTIRLNYISKEVVDVVKDVHTQIRTWEAQKIDPEVEQGDEVKIPLTKPPDELGRIAAQSAKQVLYQKVREAEREKVFNEHKDKLGELENGYVKRFERGDMIIDLNGKTEGIIPRSHQSRAERYSQGDRIKAVIVDVHTQPKGPQVVLSRTDPRLLIKLFEMEVPEIYDGTVIIKDAVREPGERAKIAVASRERDVDPVGACVGMKGSRVQSIIRELRGEKIDIIPWHEDIVVFAQNSLAPAKITRVSVTSDENAHRPHLDVIVDNDQLSLAIGKRGLNVRLAAELIGAKIDIKSEEEVKGEVADALAAMLQEAMAESRAQTNVHEIDELPPEWADMLEEAGYDDLDSVINASVEDLMAIPGVDETMANEMIEIARKHERVEDSEDVLDEDEDGEYDEEGDDAEDGDEETDGDAEPGDADGEPAEDDGTGTSATDEEKAKA
ncbi:MAG: transcription termination factor NusA [Thermoanaerobaculia bacterium]